MNMKLNILLKPVIASTLLLSIIPYTNENQVADAYHHKELKHNNKIKNINIKKYQFNITTQDGKAETTLPYTIKHFYYKNHNNQRINIKTLKSDKYGQVKGQIKVPKNINLIYVEHELKSRNDEMLLNEDRKVVKLYSHINLKKNNKINQIDKGIMGKTIYKRNLNWSYAKTWEEYFKFKKDQQNAVNYAVKELKKKGYKNINAYNSKPTKIIYENSSSPEKGLSVYSANKTQNDLKKGDHYQLIKLPAYQNNKNVNSVIDKIKVFVAHEYSHWQMVQAIGHEKMITKTGYKTHQSYNENKIVSYKEGYALLNANRYPWKFNMNGNLDIKVQTSQKVNPKYGGKENLYGKSTNYTVFNVLRDIYDPQNNIEGKADQYNIAEDVFGKGKYTQNQVEKLSNGLMYITMRDSKANTLEDYIQYMDKHYVNNHKEFYKILQLNGLNKKGEFTLDKNNKKIN